MTRNKFGSFRWIAALAGILAMANAHAAGLLIADGGFGGVLEIKEHEAQVTINNGIAVTRVTQVFHNTENRQVEALYTFPVPKGASVANFSMWINGKEMVGEVIEKKRAREIYESYKVKRQDPGLLEQVDFKTFEMRIFPIGPNADQRVEITYYQELDIDHDRLTYVYPLATSSRKDVDTRAKDKFALTLELKSPLPITELTSPSHGSSFIISKHTDNYYQASMETVDGSLAQDVVIACEFSRPQTGFDLVTSKAGDEDGYFYLTLTAGDDLAQSDEGMDYVFVLDISGSMAADGKLLLSKDSLSAFINALGEKDRFELMAFNLQPHLAFRALQPASPENKASAQTFLATQQARGGTVLNPAITTAYKYADDDRTLNVVILSDGLTEQGERQKLLQLIQQRPRNSRVFCIGVGNDVNRPLLEQLAQDSGGLAAFISPGDNFARQAAAFKRKLMRPAATDLKIDFGGMQIYDVTPKTLPNLYHGSPIRIYGRYKKSGEAQIGFRGNVNGVETKQAVTMTLPAQDMANPEIDRMWAAKRIDELLKDADRQGSRNGVLDEIIRLGEGYSIVSEYTSFLVLENDSEYQRWKIDRKNALRIGRDRKAQELTRTKLEAIRNKAMAQIGPEPETPQQLAMATPAQTVRQVPNSMTPSTPAPAAPSSQSRNLNVGTGSIGPLFLGLILLMKRLSGNGRRKE